VAVLRRFSALDVTRLPASGIQSSGKPIEPSRFYKVVIIEMICLLHPTFRSVYDRHRSGHLLPSLTLHVFARPFDQFLSTMSDFPSKRCMGADVL